MTVRLVVALAALSLLACGGPRDPEGTLARVRGGVMRVGVIDDPPFAAVVGGEAVGVEPALWITIPVQLSVVVLLYFILGSSQAMKAAWTDREEGEVLTGEVFVVPRDQEDLVSKLEKARDTLKEVNWRLYDLSIMPVARLEESEGAGDRSGR